MECGARTGPPVSNQPLPAGVPTSRRARRGCLASDRSKAAASRGPFQGHDRQVLSSALEADLPRHAQPRPALDQRHRLRAR